MEGMLFDIFSHLPAKSIFKFATISKQCNEFPTDNFFAKTQCKNMEPKDDQSFFLEPKFPQNSNPTALELGPLSNIDESSCGIPQESLKFLRNMGPVLASSNGLLCCRNLNQGEYPLFLCNPATQTWLPIVKPANDFNPKTDLNIVFECNGHASNYMLMVVLPESENWETSKSTCKIYSPSKWIWEEGGEIIVGARDIQYQMPVYLNKEGGKVYFISDRGNYLTKNSPFYWPYIVSYTIKNSVSRFLKIPKGARKGVVHDQSCMVGIFKFKDPRTCFESICLVKLMKLVFSVWVLMEDDSGIWKRIMKAGVKGMGLKGGSKPTISGFTILNGNLLLIATEEEVYRYNLSGDQRSCSSVKAEKIGWHECGWSVIFHSYSNTLRSCGDAAMPLPPDENCAEGLLKSNGVSICL